jgi:hypothetical protein
MTYEDNTMSGAETAENNLDAQPLDFRLIVHIASSADALPVYLHTVGWFGDAGKEYRKNAFTPHDRTAPNSFVSHIN